MAGEVVSEDGDMLYAGAGHIRSVEPLVEPLGFRFRKRPRKKYDDRQVFVTTTLDVASPKSKVQVKS